MELQHTSYCVGLARSLIKGGAFNCLSFIC